MVDIFLPVIDGDDNEWGQKLNDSLTNLETASVPPGGTAGQVLKKVDGTDYNANWGDDTGGTGGGAWGEITGTLSDQTDLQSALDAKVTGAVVSALSTEGIAQLCVIPNGGVVPGGLSAYTLVVELDA